MATIAAHAKMPAITVTGRIVISCGGRACVTLPASAGPGKPVYSRRVPAAGYPRTLLVRAHRLHRLLHLVVSHIADVRRDRPAMPERILEHAVAVAPEHVGDRHRDLRAGLFRLRGRRVDILDVQVNRDRRSV